MTDLLQTLRDNWFLIVFFATIVWTWNNVANRITSLEKDLQTLEITSTQINQINVSIATIQNDISNIKQTLNNYQIKIK